MIRCLCLLAATIFPAVSFAEIQRLPLEQTLLGASSITTLPDGVMVVVKDDAVFLCLLVSNRDFFMSVIEGQMLAAEHYAPSGGCVDGSIVKDLE